MKERGMIFNAEMVRAILDGRKTQMRLIMKPQPKDCPRGGHWWPSDKHRTMLHVEEALQNSEGIWAGIVGDACPFGDVGDRIWVREAFQGPLVSEELLEEYRAYPEKFENPEYCEYAADGGPRPEYCDLDDNLRHGWRPSIHMPRWASRITLEITGVRVERLNSISNVSARAEGYPVDREADGGDSDPWLWFRDLWDGIYPEQSFKHNPWVWVITFQRVEGGAA